MNNFNKNTSPQGPKGSGEKHKFINKNINLKNKNIVKINKLSKIIQDYIPCQLAACAALAEKEGSADINKNLSLLSKNLKNQKNIRQMQHMHSPISEGLTKPKGHNNLKSHSALNQVSNLNPGNNSLYLLNNFKLNKSLKSNFTAESGSNVESIINYLNSFIKFNKKGSNQQNILYQFNKSNNKSYKFLFDKASNLLKLSFLSMGCLISKPVFKVIYTKNNLEFEHNTSITGLWNEQYHKKIIIDLFYFIRKNKFKYLNNSIEVNENIIYISHPNYAAQALQAGTGRKGLKNILCKYNDKFQYLNDYLSSIFNSEVELNLTCLPKTFYDSNILVQDLAIKSYKYRFVKLVSKLYKKVHISTSSKNTLDDPNYKQIISFPSYLSGINIKLAGRTFRQRVVPRMTVKRSQKGSLSNVNIQLIDRARFTGKTRRGSFSFTITLGHVFK